MLNLQHQQQQIEPEMSFAISDGLILAASELRCFRESAATFFPLLIGNNVVCFKNGMETFRVKSAPRSKFILPKR